jgi:L-threonylcarbamoyladenylate synthase
LRVVTPGPEGVSAAVAALRRGQLVGLPTETVYGLAADAENGEAVARIFAAKGRPSFNPLIAHVADVAAARRLGALDDRAEALARAFWPGPLTLVVPFRAGAPVSDLARAGLDTIALRVPAHPVAKAVLVAFGGPVAAPSANRSGHVSATTAAHVAADLGDAVAVILDAGASPVGLESTIVGLTVGAPLLLRPGGLPAEAIEAVLGQKLTRRAGSDGTVSAPGQLESHYAPRARLRLDATQPAVGEALLAFGAVPPHAGPVLNLSPSGSLTEAAANLFGHLRALDATGTDGIAVMSVPGDGLGEAIRDRLARAAAGR